MSLPIRRSEWFIADLEHYADWYQREASWEVAERYLRAVNATLARLANMPGLGCLANFPTSPLQDIRYFPIEKPFAKHLIFYRYDKATLYIERTIHGARKLPQRFTQGPTSEEP
jgi:plasmid stabilization system protein ParE